MLRQAAGRIRGSLLSGQLSHLGKESRSSFRSFGSSAVTADVEFARAQWMRYESVKELSGNAAQATRWILWKTIPFAAVELGRDRALLCYVQPRRAVGRIVPSHTRALAQVEAKWFGGLLELVLTIVRAFHLAFLFAPALLSAPFLLLMGLNRDAWMELLYQTLRNGGPAFIKWGQWAATRADLFPPDMCTRLQRLQADAPAHEFWYTRREVETAFNITLEELFETFDEQPVASGSIAQVHRATLRPGFAVPSKPRPFYLELVAPRDKGTLEVAVKVRHPRVADIIARDFAILQFAADIAGIFPGLGWMRLDESVRQFRAPLFEQVDLRQEAQNLATFNSNFKSWKDVSFPMPIDPLVDSAVLVETFERGVTISNYMDSDDEELRKSIAETGCKVLLKMMLADNFVHADLHPGNILVRLPEDEGEGGAGRRAGLWGLWGRQRRPTVVLLDCGMTVSLTDRNKYNLLSFFEAITKGDGRGVAESTLSFSDNQTCPDPKKFVGDVEKLFETAMEWGFDVNTSEWMMAVMESVRRHKVHLAAEVCSVVVTTLVLEGWSARLDPGICLMDMIRQILFGTDRLRNRLDQLAAVLV